MRRTVFPQGYPQEWKTRSRKRLTDLVRWTYGLRHEASGTTGSIGLGKADRPWPGASSAVVSHVYV